MGKSVFEGSPRGGEKKGKGSARFNAHLAGHSPLKLMEESGIIVKYLTSWLLYKRRSYQYEWLPEHLKAVSSMGVYAGACVRGATG